MGHTQYYIKNSHNLVEKLKQQTVTEDQSLVSYDVTVLVTCDPIGESITIIKDRLCQDPTLSSRTDLNVEQICQLLEFCLTTTYFMFQGQLYEQKEGAAMGSPVSPIVANVFMEDFEQRAISSSPVQPAFWGRYVDDTLVIINTADIDTFTAHINQVHPSIKFTIEREDQGTLPMLDVLTTRKEDGSLDFSVYRKPTHTDQYLAFDSNHPL